MIMIDLFLPKLGHEVPNKLLQSAQKNIANGSNY